MALVNNSFESHFCGLVSGKLSPLITTDSIFNNQQVVRLVNIALYIWSDAVIMVCQLDLDQFDVQTVLSADLQIVSGAAWEHSC